MIARTEKKSTPADGGTSHPALLPQTHTGSLKDRKAAGKALRSASSLVAQGQWEPPSDRADPIDLLIENSQGRVEELLPIRYGRMAANPFAFYRGAAAIMAYDLSHTPATGLNIQICGDCHLLNFGGFATPERRNIFDINDFDETSIGPWEWDVKRLAASFVIAGRSLNLADSDSQEAAMLVAQSYRERMAEFASMPVLEAWYTALDFNTIIASMEDKEFRRFYSRKLEKATVQSAHEKEFSKLAFDAGGRPRITDHPPLIFHVTELQNEDFSEAVKNEVAHYLSSLPPAVSLLMSRYTLVDSALKVVGVGSVGTICGIALFMSGSGDPLFLQFKQATRSVLEPYAGASPYRHSAQRVVEGQRLMQAASDMFLGWYTGRDIGLHYYVRQLRDAKVKPVVEIMKASNLKGYARLCGLALARAHSRTGDAAVLSGYMGKSGAFDEAIAKFSLGYAEQTERDYEALIAAIRSGRIEARFGE